MLNGWYEDMFGDLKHYVNDKLHNEKCPTHILWYGSKYWKQNNQYHRLDGPAIEYGDGYKYWYYQSKLIKCNSQQEFNRIIKLKILW